MRKCLISCFLILGFIGCENDTHLTRLECPHPYLECPGDEETGGRDNPGGDGDISIVPDVPPPVVVTIEPEPEPEPDIELEPLNYDFGDIETGCEELRMIKISNVGNADLIINQIFYSATSDLFADTSVHGSFPWTVSPGGDIEVEVTFSPIDEAPDLAFMTIESNDPDEPSVVVTQRGEEHRAGTVVDQWEQTEVTKADILFVIDNSGSMREEQINIATHASDFIFALDNLAADYQIAVITTDNSSFVGPVITNLSPTRAVDLSNQIVVGTTGAAYEQGLAYAKYATSLGGDATVANGFIRNNSLLNIIFVSDEDDFSIGTAASYITHFQGLKVDPDQVMLHAVAGDVPGGCGTARPGLRYVEASIGTGGFFYSICSADWGSNLQSLANGATTSRVTFPLTATPLDSTVRVRVGGIEWLADWVYDAVQNVIIFDANSIPPAGSNIEAEYGIYGDCN
jgi:hypothetical protein